MHTLIMTLLLAAADPANKDLEVLAGPRDVPGSAMLHNYLLRAATEALERRRAAYEKVQTAEAARQWQGGS